MLLHNNHKQPVIQNVFKKYHLNVKFKKQNYLDAMSNTQICTINLNGKITNQFNI